MTHVLEAIGYPVLIICIGVGAWYLSIAIHEGAHALVAVAVGLRVKSVRIAVKNAETLVLPRGRALPARMTAMTVAGPIANAACAVMLGWWLVAQPHSPRVELTLIVVAAVAAFMALVDLLPLRLNATRSTDMHKVLRWIFRPRLTTARNSADSRQLAAIIATTADPLVLLAAVIRRHEIDPTGYAEFTADADRLLSIARDGRTERAKAKAIARWLSLYFGFAYLHMTITAGQPVDRANREEIIETAELAVRLDPKSKPARIGLAIARLLDDRPTEALDLLANFRSSTKGQHEVAVQLYAIAQMYLGHQARADALLASVTEPADAQLREILGKLRNATELPPLRRPDSEPALPAVDDGPHTEFHQHAVKLL